MRLSTKTIEAFIKAGGENYKHINKDKELVEKYTQHILNIADKAYKNPLKQILKCVFGNFLSSSWEALKCLFIGLIFIIIFPFMLVYSIEWITLKRIFLCFKYKKEIKVLLEKKENKC